MYSCTLSLIVRLIYIAATVLSIEVESSVQCRTSALLIENCSEVYECNDGTLCCKHSNGSFECTCQGQITAECECPIGFEQIDSLCYSKYIQHIWFAYTCS